MKTFSSPYNLMPFMDVSGHKGCQQAATIEFTGNTKISPEVEKPTRK